jgi:integrase
MGIPESSRSNVLISEFFRRIKDYAHVNYSPQHLQSDLSRIDALQAFFARKGVKHLRSISPGIIEEFMTKELVGRSPKTRKNYLSLLKTILNYAVKWNVLDRNPIAGIRPPKVVIKFHFFSKVEATRLIEQAQEPLKTVITILVNTGLRRAELFSLRWQDVDIRAKKLRGWPYDSLLSRGKSREVSRSTSLLAMHQIVSKKTETTQSMYCGHIQVFIPSIGNLLAL